jgi:hypothetical protein
MGQHAFHREMGLSGIGRPQDGGHIHGRRHGHGWLDGS